MEKLDLEAIRDLLRRQAEARAARPDRARRALIDEGIYNEAGELLPRYGGRDDLGDD